MRQGDKLHRRLMVLGAVLGLAGGLAACTSGGGAEPEPSTSTGATSAPTAVPSDEPTSERPEVPKPVPPETMARDDVAGAEAAAQYFLELYPYVYATGDLSEWKAMSDPDCIFCASVVDNVTELHDSGRYQEGGSLRITGIESRPPGEESDYFAVWVDAEEASSHRLDDNGNTSEPAEGGPIEIDMALHYASGQWRVRAVESFEGSEG